MANADKASVVPPQIIAANVPLGEVVVDATMALAQVALLVKAMAIVVHHALEMLHHMGHAEMAHVVVVPLVGPAIFVVFKLMFQNKCFNKVIIQHIFEINKDFFIILKINFNFF